MGRRRRSEPAEPERAEAGPQGPSLGHLSLQPGDRVRFRRAAGQHWQEATVIGRERDGSVSLRDEKGATRSIPVERLEVFRLHHRVGKWVPVEESDWEQLSLFDGPATTTRRNSKRTG